MADSTPSMDDVELNLDTDSDDMALAAMFEPQPPPDAVPEAMQAPERVKFAVPAILSFDGYEETFDVSILNLSTHGVACTGPQGLAVRDRLRLAFRLNLAAEPLSFPCEVMWVHNGADQKSTYGLRFEELDDAVRSQVGEVVRERAEGRAGEWPMPIMPPPAAPTPPPALVIPKTRWSSVIAGSVAGVCVGVAVTLVITLWFGATEPPAAAPRAAAHADQPEMAPGVGEAPEGLAMAPFHGEGGPAAPLPEPDLEAADGVDDAEVPAPALAQPAAKPAAPQAAKPATPAPAAKPAVAASTVRLRKIGNLRVEEAPDKVALTLLADGAVSKHDVFWLQNPPRVVVDIPERKSGFQVKLFEVGHPLVNRLRVGQHPGKVRFVIETGKDVAPKIVSEHAGNSVRVEVRRR